MPAKKTNPWINYVKMVAKKDKIPYGQAIKKASQNKSAYNNWKNKK